MPGGVIEVERRRGFALLERSHVPMLVRAVCIPMRHLLRNLVARLRGGALSSFTQPLSDGPALLPLGSLGMPVLVEADDGTPRCVSCELCAIACPAHCIRIEGAAAGGAGSPRRFQIDMSRCLFCGLCEEACPEEAIVLSPVVAPSASGQTALCYEMEQLLVPSERLGPSLERVRDLGRANRPDPPALRVVAGEGAV